MTNKKNDKPESTVDSAIADAEKVLAEVKAGPVIPEEVIVPGGDVLPLRWVRVSHKTPDHIAARYLYAAYGSNLALAQMGRRCPAIDIIGPGILRNARLVFARYLGIVQDDAATIQVGVYKCTAADVAALDRYEGLGRAYERILVTVECNGVAVRCFTYLKKDNAPEQPSDKYYETCLTGFNDWQFDSRRLRHAREHARKNEKPRAAHTGNHWWYKQNSSLDIAANGDSPGTYRSDEPLGNGTAESYNRQQIARAAARNRSPRPAGGRLGGARYVDERLPLQDFQRQIKDSRIPPVPTVIDNDDPTRISVENGNGQNVFQGRNGQLWIKNPKGHGWIRKE